MRLSFSSWLFLCSLAFTLTATPSRAETDPLIQELVAPQGFLSARLSPDGKHIAAIGFTGRNYSLMLVNADTMAGKVLIVGTTENRADYIYQKRPRRAMWITNELIGVDYGYTAEAVDLTGKRIASLGESIIGKADHDRPDSPLVLSYTDSDKGDTALFDATTGLKTKFKIPMSGQPIAPVWDSRGELRALTLINSARWQDVTRVSNWYRPSSTSEWIKLEETGINDEFWTPIAVPQEENTIIVRSRIGRDTYAIFNYDTKRRQIGEMLAGHPTQDILHARGELSQPFESVVTNGLVPQTVWFDPAWAAIQKAVDEALPKRINTLSGNPQQRVLVYSYSDIDPGHWYLLDRATMRLREVASRKTSIKPDRMRPMETLSYFANDGLSIPAYLTRPAGDGGPAPTVIMIHGGPTERDDWAWNEDVQFLAAKGYVVFQPQFRGSSGFGKKFEVAGYGQWGLAMQDDVTAGVDYLTKKGIADPERICIYGSSYGGYAALWGLVKTPNLYKCGISFAGVSDIEYMFEDSSDSNSDKVTRELLRSRIGDVRVSKAQFDATSPLKHADKIKAPVLLMHGNDDERVPVSHAKKMKRALEDHKKKVEWVLFLEEGHGLHFIKNQVEYYEKLSAFLDKYIGNGRAGALAK